MMGPTIMCSLNAGMAANMMGPSPTQVYIS